MNHVIFFVSPHSLPPPLSTLLCTECISLCFFFFLLLCPPLLEPPHFYRAASSPSLDEFAEVSVTVEPVLSTSAAGENSPSVVEDSFGCFSTTIAAMEGVDVVIVVNDFESSLVASTGSVAATCFRWRYSKMDNCANAITISFATFSIVN